MKKCFSLSVAGEAIGFVGVGSLRFVDVIGGTERSLVAGKRL